MPYMKTSFDIIIIIILYTILKYTTYSKASNDKVSTYLISSLRHWCVGMRPRSGM